jgi:uncharacterized protein
MPPLDAEGPRFAGAFALGKAEVRVLGCLLEKQRTTPDMYPLTLNALRLACNQSTNRDPVVAYDEAIVRDALHRLERRGFIRLASGRGSRAPKYRHLLAEALPMGGDEHAVMCVLMLRGPQTPGELKQRAERMHPFAGLDAVHDTLARLIERGLVARLERRPGQKEERYVQLLQDSDAAEGSNGRESDAMPATSGANRPEGWGVGAREGDGDEVRDVPREAGFPAGTPLAALTERVAQLEREVAGLRAELEPRMGGEAPADRGQAGPNESSVPNAAQQDWP